jgi:hypothetical protein
MEGEILPVGYTLHPEQVTLAGPDRQPIAGGDGEVVARGRYLGRPVAEQVTALQDAPWQFWRDPDNRLRLTIAAPLAAGDPQAEHDERVWIAVQACGEFLASPWREAPYARTWGDMAHFLSVSRTPGEVGPGAWVDFDQRRRTSA